MTTSNENATAATINREEIDLNLPVIKNHFETVKKDLLVMSLKRKHSVEFDNITLRTDKYFPTYEEDDDQEFLNVRGASPTMHLRNKVSEYNNMYLSDNSNYSCDSFDSMDKSTETKRPRKQFKNRREKIKFDKRKTKETNDTVNDKCRKLELCKFYLMDCCAKRNNCLYMHSDFPCKYYYLGLHCILKDKNKCKFQHGAPLTDNVRTILLKHLETAPKEILGDFPRISRENACKMLDETALDLKAKSVIFSPSIKIDQNSSRIPSLLDIHTTKPDNNLLSNTLIDANKSLKPKKTRWSNNFKDKPIEKKSLETPTISKIKCLTSTQVEQLGNLGMHTFENLNSLTMAQLNELNISVEQIRFLQMSATNIHQPEFQTKFQNIDKKLHASSNLIRKDTQNVSDKLKVDVDMRVLVPSDLEIIKKEYRNNIFDQKSTGSIDYTQYLKDSNIESHSDEEELQVVNNTVELQCVNENTKFRQTKHKSELDSKYDNYFPNSSCRLQTTTSNYENENSLESEISAPNDRPKDSDIFQNRITIYDKSLQDIYESNNPSHDERKYDTDMRILKETSCRLENTSGTILFILAKLLYNCILNMRLYNQTYHWIIRFKIFCRLSGVVNTG